MIHPHTTTESTACAGNVDHFVSYFTGGAREGGSDFDAMRWPFGIVHFSNIAAQTQKVDTCNHRHYSSKYETLYTIGMKFPAAVDFGNSGDQRFQ